MKRLFLFLILVCLQVSVFGQAKTTEALLGQFKSPTVLYFYKNTLKMFNQTANKEYDEMIKNIEKMKFLMLDKSEKNFGPAEYKKLKSNYQSEKYESIMASRYQGRNFDIYVKDADGSSPGTVILVNDSTRLFVLDMIGTVDVSKAGSLFSAVSDGAGIGEIIQKATDGNKSGKGKSDH